MTDKNDTPLVLGFSEYASQTERFAKAAGLPFSLIDVHRFPDGESKLTLPSKLPGRVIIMRSLDRPNDKLVELILAAAGARQLGASKVILIAPYLCYMRQDKAFHPGEVVSQPIIGQCLAAHIDAIVTVDSHLHRVHRLSDAVPVADAINLTATDPMAHFLQQNVDNPFLIGPDGESEQWVSDIASHYGFDFRVAQKERLGDRRVRITMPEGSYQGRNLVLVDDVASTGKTLLEAARLLQPYQPASLSVLVTHALFVDHAEEELHAAGVDNIWSCDAIPHPSNRVELADLLAGSLLSGKQLQ
ncbi:ribose-phosphate diphosphokinase [Thiolapillus brandeum]|uniref:Ribose-phosphate pyrophosphokinase n=1 Tax=Thiolapillus brandeum TaxID=1076588 RepID=A0A7U6GIG9_9GAMM|nr:ribose-phosphate diphosphokinase [Thiolapillus brandeum]BAO44261.1 ribose-phosphate pyrophosphokinase [Thiolapillus brandeum]